MVSSAQCDDLRYSGRRTLETQGPGSSAQGHNWNRRACRNWSVAATKFWRALGRGN